MSAELTVLYVPADGDEEVRTIPATLAAMQALIGGYLEAISGSTLLAGNGRYRHWTAYLDEEGLLKGLPVNRRATLIARALGWQSTDVISGPVVFMGPPDSEGRETDVPKWLLALLNR